MNLLYLGRVQESNNFQAAKSKCAYRYHTRNYGRDQEPFMLRQPALQLGALVVQGELRHVGENVRDCTCQHPNEKSCHWRTQFNPGNMSEAISHDSNRSAAVYQCDELKPLDSQRGKRLESFGGMPGIIGHA